MQHPVQALATVGTFVISACNSTLTCFDQSTSQETSTSTPHTSLIRLLSTYTDPSTSTCYLISTGEDKQLVVSRLPSLELVNQRELVKRANALELTREGDIVVGDKFGDVYNFPLHPPPTEEEFATTSTREKDSKKPLPEFLPILGHVSMLNALSLIPSTSTNNNKSYIATGDRDEHVRISRYPLGHVIEGYLWGSKKFVSSLLYIAPTATSPRPLLLSAGGDSTIQTFDLNLPADNGKGDAPVGRLIGQYEVEKVLLDKVSVAPVLPDPVPAGRKKDKKGKSRSNQTTGEGDEEMGGHGEEGEGGENDKKELKTGLAVIKMVQVGTERERGGVIVLAAGCTALLYIPFSSLLSSTTPPTSSHSLLEFPHPILDFTPLPIPTSSESSLEFLVSLDTTRPLPSTTPSSSSNTSFVSITFSQSSQTISILPTSSSTLPKVPSIETNEQPSISSLYPVLMMLHHPGDESDLAGFGDSASAALPTTGGGGDAVELSGVGDGKPKGGVRAGTLGGGKKNRKNDKKRPSSELEGGSGSTGGGEGEEEDGDGRRNSGKRAIGRAETLRRWEEAKKKLQETGEDDEKSMDLKN